MDTFANNGYINTNIISDDMVRTPINLFGRTRSKLNEGKKYHSGRISVGVEKAFAGYKSSRGDTTDNPRPIDKVPRMTDGNMYSISLGQAGSP